MESTRRARVPSPWLHTSAGSPARASQGGQRGAHGRGKRPGPPTRTGGGGSLQAWHRSSRTGQRPALSLRSGLPSSLGAKSIRVKGKHPASGRDQGPGLVRRG